MPRVVGARVGSENPIVLASNLLKVPQCVRVRLNNFPIDPSQLTPEGRRMLPLPPPPPPVPLREVILSNLALASLRGYLGLFAGTGLSKAATSGAAPGFEELLKQAAERLGLSSDFESLPFRRKSLPQVASALVGQIRDSGYPADPAERLRQAIADLCAFAPDPSVEKRLGGALRAVQPGWIITTNYDLVLEALIEDAEGTLPTQPLVARPDRVPIYHLHGHRHEPSSIRVTEEDYVTLLAPIDYQRLKLPLLLIESATLMLGYSLGDINVRSAMEWSRSFRGSSSLRLHPYQGIVVQALWTPSPCADPYTGSNDEFIVEISDVTAFLEELAIARLRIDGSIRQTTADIHQFLSDTTNAMGVATDAAKKADFLNIVQHAMPYCSTSRLIDFMAQVLDPVWVLTRENGAFSYYDLYLSLTLDILARLTLTSANPNLVRYLGKSLNRVGSKINPLKPLGSAHDATDRWIADHRMIPSAVARELRLFSMEADNGGLARMLSFVAPW